MAKPKRRAAKVVVKKKKPSVRERENSKLKKEIARLKLKLKKTKPKANPRITNKLEIIKLGKTLNRHRHTETKIRAIAYHNMRDSGLYSDAMARRALWNMTNGILLKATTATISDFQDMAEDSYYDEYDEESGETYNLFWYHD